MEKTFTPKPPKDEPKKPQSFKEIMTFLEIESNNLDQFIQRAPKESIDAKLTYCMRAITIMGTAVHAALERLSDKHDVQIQIVPSITPPGNSP